MSESRDRFDNLICPVPGCGKVIQALTGLQELQKLRTHMKRCHCANWSLEDTLKNRDAIENKDGGNIK